jgi:hypothetical protein
MEGMKRQKTRAVLIMERRGVFAAILLSATL